MIIPERLFQGTIENKSQKIYNPKTLKQRAKGNNKLVEKQLNKELAEEMIILQIEHYKLVLI